MSGYEVTYNGNRTVDLKLSGVTVLEVCTTDPERSDDYVTLGMSQSVFEWLSGDKVRAHLKSSLDDALDQVQRLSDERDEWKERAEGGLSRAGASALSDVRRAVRIEHAKYPDEAREFHTSIDTLEKVAEAAVYQENGSGGDARSIVAEVARVLGVDLDEGPGHRWDREHMARVVRVADDIRDERDDLRERVEQLTEERDRMTAQCDEAIRRAALVDAVRPIRMEVPTELFMKPVDEGLKDVIVSQAREIARLKGESE